LRAQLPNGTITTVAPGATAQFPLGTQFDRAANTQIVTVQTGTTTKIIQNPDRPPIIIVVPIFEQRIQVVGPSATANVGGIPVNVVRGAFVIYENESPRPTDRVYVNYNYYNNVNPTLVVPGLPQSTVNRETFGLEKTFYGGDASIGLRLPLLQLNGADNFERQGLGDLTAIFKYALVNDYYQNPEGTLSPGNVLSGGLAVTAPTGRGVAYSAFDPVIHSTLLQPWVGGILIRGNAYVQGFSSIAVPTDSSDTTFIFNSLQIGYLLYEAPRDTSRWITSITPIAEVHVIDPLTNRGLTRLPIGAVDMVTLTGGVTLGLGSRSGLNLGVDVPVTGPRPYTIEAIVQFNFRY
jgi:hypothetical protein